MYGPGRGNVNGLLGKRIGHPPGVFPTSVKNSNDPRRWGTSLGTQQSGVGPALPVKGRHLHGLTALRVVDLQSVSGRKKEGGDRAAPYPVALDAWGEIGQSRDENPGARLGHL